MKANRLHFLMLLLFCIGAVQGLQDLPIYKIDAAYIINSDSSVNESINFTLSQAANRTLNLSIEHNISNVHVGNTTDSLNFTMEEAGDRTLLHILLDQPQTRISLSYVSRENIFQKDSVSLFLKNFGFKNIIQKMSVYVELPQGAALYNNEYSPKSGEIATDGSRISVIWGENSVAESIAFSVKYTEPLAAANSTIKEIIVNETKGKFKLWQTIVLILILALVAYYIYSLRKAKKNLLTGFREDEQKVILFLLKNKDTWQNRIQHAFNFPRAKVTRIVKRLEEQNLIKKENYGRTNKIRWKK